MENLQKWNKGNYFYQALEQAVTGVLLLSVSLVTNHHKRQGPVDERDRQPVSAHQRERGRRRLQLTQLPTTTATIITTTPKPPATLTIVPFSLCQRNLLACFNATLQMSLILIIVCPWFWWSVWDVTQ